MDVLGNQVGAVDMSKWLSFFTYVQLVILRWALILEPDMIS